MKKNGIYLLNGILFCLILFFTISFFVVDDYYLLSISQWRTNIEDSESFISIYSMNISINITLAGIAIALIGVFASKSTLSVSTCLKYFFTNNIKTIFLLIIYTASLIVTLLSGYLRYTYFVDVWLKVSLVYPLILVVLTIYNIINYESVDFITEEMKNRIVMDNKYEEYYEHVFMPFFRNDIYQSTVEIFIQLTKDNLIKDKVKIYKVINEMLFKIDNAQEKLEYLIRTSYVIQLAPTEMAYVDYTRNIVDQIFKTYINCLSKHYEIESGVLLNLKEIVYYLITFEHAKLSDDEFDKCILVYQNIINKAYNMIQCSVRFLTNNEQIIIDQLNIYNKYTQFWETTNWKKEYKGKIQKLIDRRNFNYKCLIHEILMAMINGKLSMENLYRACINAIRLFGFIKSESAYTIFYEDQIEQEGVHSIKYTYFYVTYIFLFTIAIENSWKLFEELYLLWEDSLTDSKTMDIQSFYDNLITVDYTDIRNLLKNTNKIGYASHQIENKILKIKDFLEKRRDDNLSKEIDTLCVEDIDSSKIEDLTNKIKTEMQFNDIEFRKIQDLGEKSEWENQQIFFYLRTPKKLLIQNSTSIMIENFYLYKYLYLEVFNKLQALVKEPNQLIYSLEELDTSFKYLVLSDVGIISNQKYNIKNIPGNFYGIEAEINNIWFSILINAKSNNEIWAFSEPVYIKNEEISIEVIERETVIENDVFTKLRIKIPFAYHKNIKMKKYELL